MRYKPWLWSCISLITVVALTAVSCGGGGNKITPGAGTPDPTPVVVFHGGGGGGNNSDLPPIQPIQGGFDTAPLGTNPDYDVQPGGSTVTPVSGTSRATSTLGAGQQFKLNWITLTNSGATPDPTKTSFTFQEGQAIDMYANYEIAANLTYCRQWVLDSAGLSYTEPAESSGNGGTFLAKFHYVIPIGAAAVGTNFEFNAGLGSKITSGATKAGSLVVIVDVQHNDPGIFCGHIDVDTSHLIYPLGKGTTDGHIHQYDDKHNVTRIDYLPGPGPEQVGLLDSNLHNINRDIIDPNQKFKLIVANADLSPGGRLVINKTYNRNDPTTYILSKTYAAKPLNTLPIYSLGGVAGTTKLTNLGWEFLTTAIKDRQLIGTNTGDVRGNVPGPYGATPPTIARNGALILQAVKVNADGTDAFTTALNESKGGVQGVATAGLLWETTLFWHWQGPSYHQSGWATYDPSKDLTCIDDGTNPPTNNSTLLGSGDLGLDITALPGVTQAITPASGGTSQMCWEDLNTNGDDYNDFVGRLNTTELYDASNKLKQINIYVKANARGATDTSAWQYNWDMVLPGTKAYTDVRQVFDDEDGNMVNDAEHQSQTYWTSTNGANMPVFATTKDALPKPADSATTTNTVNNTTYVMGDYALVRIVLETPIAKGSYTAAPYTPELRVQPTSGTVYIYHLWQKVGDPVLTSGNVGYPKGGFLIPDANFPWALEGKHMKDCFNTSGSTWTQWIAWIQGGGAGTQPKFWTKPTKDYFVRANFK